MIHNMLSAQHTFSTSPPALPTITTQSLLPGVSTNFRARQSSVAIKTRHTHAHTHRPLSRVVINAPLDAVQSASQSVTLPSSQCAHHRLTSCRPSVASACVFVSRVRVHLTHTTHPYKYTYIVLCSAVHVCVCQFAVQSCRRRLRQHIVRFGL